MKRSEICTHRPRFSKEKIETALASESSLRKDWMRPEEDEAWQDL